MSQGDMSSVECIEASFSNYVVVIQRNMIREHRNLITKANHI